MAPVNEHLNILLPLKSAVQLLIEIGIRPPYDDRHHPGPWLRRVSCFGDLHKKSWEHSHLDLLVFGAGDLKPVLKSAQKGSLSIEERLVLTEGDN